MVYEDGEYWLEFDLKEVHIITAFEIHTVHKNNKSEFPKPLIFSLNYTRFKKKVSSISIGRNQKCF